MPGNQNGSHMKLIIKHTAHIYNSINYMAQKE